MALFMLDTGISPYIMRQFSSAVPARIGKAALSDACNSVITYAALLFGVETSPERRRGENTLGDILCNLEMFAFPLEAGLHDAEIRATLKRSGMLIGPTICSWLRMLVAWGSRWCRTLCASSRGCRG